MSKFRIAIAQINPTVGHLSKNAKKILRYIDKAKKKAADLIVFPELTLIGYPPEDLLLKKHFVESNLKELKELSKKIRGITAVVGFADSKGKKLYNAAAILSNKKVAGVYHKQKLPNYGIFDEERYFSKGNNNQVFELSGFRFGISICEDIWAERSPCSRQVASHVDVLINMSASPYHMQKKRTRFQLMRERAKKFNTSICYVNLIGGQDEVVFDGNSFLVGPKGELITSLKEFEEDVAYIDLGKKKITKRKQTRNKLKTTRLVSGKMPIKIPLTYNKKAPTLSRIEEVYGALVLGVRDYILKNKFQSVVIGLSGGIDSALTAAIASDAIGANNVKGISMPSKYSSTATQRDAQRLAKRMGISFRKVPIKTIYDVYLKTLKEAFKKTKIDATEENIQARIRGNILMAFSNKFGWLVLTTGNKSEMAVGYATLYGDMAGGYAVLKDVPKGLVYELSNYYNVKEGKEIIPKTIIERPPTAELRFHQKDQDTLPPYEFLDRVLGQYVEEDASFSAIRQNEKESKNIKKVIRMIDFNEYKRRQAPPGIKITSKAFGKDRRLPITNRYQEF